MSDDPMVAVLREHRTSHNPATGGADCACGWTGAFTRCGGCRGLGNHQRHCPCHPNYHPFRRLADRAEDIGDQIGSNDFGVANMAYTLAGRIKELVAVAANRTATPPDHACDERCDHLGEWLDGGVQ